MASLKSTSPLSPSGEDEGSATTVSEDERSIWETIPTQAFIKIVKILLYTEEFSVEKFREVCSAWKQLMDFDYGLTVKIDETNLEFIKKVNIKEARILKLVDPVPQDLFQSRITVTRLFLAGPVPLSWFSLLPLFENLSKLVLRGGFFNNEEFSEEDSDYTLPQTSLPTISLPSLNSLEIIANEYTYPYMSLRTRIHDPARGAAFDNQTNEMVIKVARNIAYILSTLRCSSLRIFQIYTYERDSLLIPPESNWRFIPLETFLESHKDSLEQLYLPSFKGKHLMANDESRGYPKNLKKLSLTLSNFVVDRERGPREQDSTYLKSLLSNQIALKAVQLDLNDFPQRWLEEILTSISRNCSQTLTFVEIIILLEDNFAFSCSTFENCHCLEVLKLNCPEEEAFIHDLTSLPPSLKQLNIMSCFITVPNPPEEMKKYKKLEMLELSMVMIDAGLRGRLLETLQNVFEIRGLNYVGINFSESVAECPKLKEILENFTAFYSPRMQYTGMKINYNYELQEGWSEDVFDPGNNDREYIHHQEAENMTSWGTSPSMNSEDPRVILFQNIPVVIGRIGFVGENDDDDADDEDDERIAFQPPNVDDDDDEDFDWDANDDQN